MNKLKIIQYDICDSTNTRAKEYIKNEKTDRALFIANEQSAGRGRQGKSFYSPKDTGIYMTYVFACDMPRTSIVSVTTSAACAVCRALERVSQKKLSIKWVNDIYLGDKKICGILTECVTNRVTNGTLYVIIGIGVNLTTELFPDDISEIAASLGDFDKQTIIENIVSELEKIADNPTFKDMDYYKSHSMVIGRQITCITNGETKNAMALDIDNDGGLVVKFENGDVKTLTSGEISIRII